MKTGKSSILKKALLAASLGIPLAVLAGCSLGVLFPVANQHAAGWVQEHGKKVQAAGGAEKATVENGMTCVMCHTAKMSDTKAIANSPGANSTCYTCHQGGPTGNPHDTEWLRAHQLHVVTNGGHDKAIAPKTTAACNTCHTSVKDASGSIPPSPKAQSTCFTCHDGPPTYNPHAEDWWKAQVHGRFVKDAGGYDKAFINNTLKQSCDSCHTAVKDASGSVPTNPLTSKTCFTCHNGPTGNTP